MDVDKNREIEERQATINDLQMRVSHFSAVEQDLWNTRNQLDNQINRFTRIDNYALEAFKLNTISELNKKVCEGIVDIFQLEFGAIINMRISNRQVELVSECNLPAAAVLPEYPAEWMEETGRDESAEGRVFIFDSPISQPWGSLSCARLVLVPFWNQKKDTCKVILGGISVEKQVFYEFDGTQLDSSFIMYCQFMHSIEKTLEAIDAANKANKAKDRFLTNMSHEIRTPLNAIVGMSEIAKRAEEPEKVKQCLDHVHASSLQLLGLINNIMDVSRIEEKGVQLKTVIFDLKRFLNEFAMYCDILCQDQEQTFTLECFAAPELPIYGDPGRLTQVLMNLVSNAVKFTPEDGFVKLTAEIVKWVDSNVLVHFAVSDTGKGISEDAAAKIFDLFEQEDNSSTRKYGGAGVGLPLSVRIAEAMGSEIKLKSKVNEGSEFSFAVLFQCCREQASSTRDYSGSRALIVDDVEINCDIIAEILAETSIQTDFAETGLEAYEKFMEHPEGYYNIIFMDIQMPVMDGYAAARAIRNSAKADARTVVIIAVTANVLPADIEEAEKSGMSAHIGKPVAFSLLLETVERFLQAGV